MKKIVLLLLSITLLSGCKNTSSKKDNVQQPDNNIHQPEQTSKNTIESLAIDNYIISDVAYNKDKLILLYSANGNTEISPSKIIVADSNNYTILKEIDDENLYINSQIVTFNKGFYINQGSDIIIYDYQLNVIKEIKLDSLHIKFSAHSNGSNIAISDDLSQIAYINSENRALTVRNIETKEEKDIYKLSDQVGNIMDFDQIYFCDEYIAFTGKYIYAKEFEIAGSNAYGRINIETSQIDFHEKNETTSKFYDGHMLIIDLMRVDDNDHGTGKTIIYDVKNNKLEEVKLDKSYNSFQLDFPSSNLIVSYNDIGRNNAKLILYQDKKNKVFDEGIPKEILESGSCYDNKKNMLIVYYLIPDGENVKSEIKGVNLSGE